MKWKQVIGSHLRIEILHIWKLVHRLLQGGRQNEDVQLLAISHSGLRLVKRELGHKEGLHVLQSFG